jgi:uncharacterized repeat protein (TIGR01451 family)
VVNQELVCDLSKSESLPELPPGVTLTDIFPFTISSDTAAFSYPDCERDETCGVIGLIPPAGGWASVTTSTPETDLDNNYDTAGLVIAEAQTDLRISKVALTTVPNPNESPGLAHPAYVAGEKFGYEIDLWVPARADGTSWADASGVALKDTVPNGFLITQANPGQGTCAIAGDSKSVSCDVGAVRASSDPSAPQKVSIYVYGTIGADVTAEISIDGGAVNTAEATSTTKDSAGDPTSVRAQAATDVIQQADLEVSKLADAAVSYAGAQVGYTITTINNGPSNSQNTVITDSLPLGLTLDLTNSPGCVVQTEATASAGQVIKCVPTIPGQTAGEIPANGSVNTRIVASTDPRDLRPYWCSLPATEGQTCPEVLPPADLNSEYPRALLNNVAVASSSNDTKPENNEAHVTTQLKALADVAISGAVSTDTPSAGSELTYTLAAFNNGPSSLDNPKVVVTLPPGFEVATDADGKYKVTGGYMDCTVTPGTSYTVTCVAWKATPTRDSLDPGFSVPGTITVNIPDDTPAGAYTAHAHTYSRSPVQCGADNPDEDPAVGTCESNYNNNQVDVTVNVVQSADTSLVKTLVEPDPIRLGQEVVYDLTVKNDGPSVADDVTISDVVPVGMTFVSGTVPGASCELADPSAPGDTGSTEEDPANPDDQAVVRCQAGSLAPGSTVKATLVFKVATNFAGDVCNSGLVGSGALDPKADNNQDKKCAGVAQPANTDLGVKVTADKGQVTPGQKATFRAVVTNNGPWDASGAAVTFTVPPGLSAATVTPISRSDGGTLDPCTASGQVFTCLIGDLAVGETAEYDVAGTAVGVAGDRLVVVADVTHNFADTDPSNDESQAEEAVISGVTPPGPTPTPSGSGSGGGSLSGTGSDSLGLAGWALAAVIVGAGLVALRLRRQGGQ